MYLFIWGGRLYSCLLEDIWPDWQLLKRKAVWIVCDSSGGDGGGVRRGCSRITELCN